MNDCEKTLKSIKDALNERLEGIRNAENEMQSELSKIANELRMIDEQKEAAISSGNEDMFVALSAKEGYLTRRREWITNEGKNIGVSDIECREFVRFVRGNASDFENGALKKATALAKELAEIMENAEKVNQAANGAIATWNGKASAAGATIYDNGILVSELANLKAYLMRSPAWKALAGLPTNI